MGKYKRQVFLLHISTYIESFNKYIICSCLNVSFLFQSEKVKRSHLEKLHLKTSMQCQLFASENLMMRNKIIELENRLKVR